MPKATVITSNISAILDSLKHDGMSKRENTSLQTAPKMTKLGVVIIYSEKVVDGLAKVVPVEETLYKLEYGDKVVLEKVIRNPDEDGIDYLISETYNKDNQPKEWLIEDTGEYDDVSDEVAEYDRANPNHEFAN